MTMLRFRLSAVALLALTAPALAQNITVKDASGTTQTIRAPNPNGRAAAASSAPVTLSTEDYARLQAIITALGTPFQAGGSIGNTAFGISGTLPAFASTPTFNLGTLGGASTAANQTSELTKLDTLHTDFIAATPAGTNNIGKVTVQVGGSDVATSNPVPVQPQAPTVGTATSAATNVTVSGSSGTPTAIVSARTGAPGTGRVRLSIINEGTNPLRVCFVSNCTVGLLLPGVLGASLTLNTTAAVWAYQTGGSQAVSVMEEY